MTNISLGLHVPHHNLLATPSWRSLFREALNVRAVPTFEMDNVGTVPMFRMHNVMTVPTSKMHNIGTVPMFKMQNNILGFSFSFN